jgi:hypothetical protein
MKTYSLSLPPIRCQRGEGYESEIQKKWVLNG